MASWFSDFLICVLAGTAGVGIPHFDHLGAVGFAALAGISARRARVGVASVGQRVGRHIINRDDFWG